MTTSDATNQEPVINPIFLNNEFFENAALKDLVFEVMKAPGDAESDEKAEVAAKVEVGALSGRHVETNPPCWIVRVIRAIWIGMQKLWHNMRKCSASYKENFLKAAELISKCHANKVVMETAKLATQKLEQKEKVDVPAGIDSTIVEAKVKELQEQQEAAKQQEEIKKEIEQTNNSLTIVGKEIESLIKETVVLEQGVEENRIALSNQQAAIQGPQAELKSKQDLKAKYDGLVNELNEKKKGAKAVANAFGGEFIKLKNEISSLKDPLAAAFGKDAIKKANLFDVGVPFELDETKVTASIQTAQQAVKSIQDEIDLISAKITAGTMQVQKKREETQQKEQTAAELNTKVEELKKKVVAPSTSVPASPKIGTTGDLPIVGESSDPKEAVKVESKSAEAPKSAQVQMFEEFDRRGLKLLKEVFSMALAKFPGEMIESFKIRESGEFEVKVKQTIRLWVPSRGLQGGAVMKIGENQDRKISGKMVDGKLDKDNENYFSNALKDSKNKHISLKREQIKPKGMILETGIDTVTYQGMFGYPTAKVDHLLEITDSEIMFSAGACGFHKGESKSIELYRDAWGNKGHLINKDEDKKTIDAHWKDPYK